MASEAEVAGYDRRRVRSAQVDNFMMFVWLPVSIYLTTAKQLRIAKILGPGEFGLIVFGIYMLVTRASRSVVRKSLVDYFLYFFYAGIVMMTISFCYNTLTTLWLRPAWWYDFLAYGLVLFFIYALHLRNFTAAEYERALKMVIVTTVVVTGLAYFFESLVIQLFELNPNDNEENVLFVGLYYEGVRFVGLSENPNQLARALAPAPPLLLYFAFQARTLTAAFAYLGLGAAAIFFGMLTGSDGLFVAWAFTAGIAATAWIHLNVVPKIITIGGVAQIVGTGIMILLLVGIAVLTIPTLSDWVFKEVFETAPGVTDERLEIWSQGLTQLFEAPIFGIGPGLHIDLRQHSSFGIFLEAHNLILDWALSTGIVGALCLITLLVYVGLKVLDAGHPLQFAAYACMVTIGMANNPVRNPIYWFYLIAIAMAAMGYVRPARTPRLRANSQVVMRPLAR